MNKVLLFCLIFLLNITTIHANPRPVEINVDLFLSSTCPHCQKADAFFHELEKKKPWIVVHRYMINQDKSALQKFYERLQQQNSNNFSVPAVFFCSSRWTGFNATDTTGKALVHAITYCRHKITQQGELSPPVITVLQKWGMANEMQLKQTVAQSLPLLILLTALVDALSPCSLFCFSAFLAFLWLSPSRKGLQASIGIVFLLSLGVIHYVQQVHSAFYYQIISKLKFAEILVGLLLFFAVLRTYRKKIPLFELKPGLLIFALIIVTVWSIQIYQQSCAFNMALVLEQWLTEHPLTPEKRFFYQLVYQVVYLVPMGLLLVFYLIFGCRKRMIRHQQMLTIAASLILLSIGLLLVVYPQWLANLVVSILVPMASICIAIIYRYRYEQIN